MYRIKVYARRGNQPCYSYVEYPRVKGNKAAAVTEDVAYDVLWHETRSGLRGNVTRLGSGFVVRVNGNVFIVRKVRNSK